MSRVAFLFPGQGARNVSSGLKLARSLPDGVQLLALATSEDLEANAGRALERTEVLQPVLAAICLTIHGALLRAGVTPSLVLGHSLGELPAFAAAGVITAEAAVKLAVLRGALMAREAGKHPGGLIALDSLAAAKAALSNGAELAAVNAPDEVVISGTEASLRGVAGRRVPVSGAWHSKAMSGAVDEFRAALKAVEPSVPRVPLISNLDGAVGRSLDTLADQLTQTVHFTAALKAAVEQGVDTFVTVGPGAVLRGLVRKNLGATVRVLTTEDAHDFERTLSALEGAARDGVPAR